MGPRLVCVLLCAVCAFAAGKERIVESVLPSLAYGSSCWSSIDLQNLGDRDVTLELEAHRASGALVALVDHPQLTLNLAPASEPAFASKLTKKLARPG